MTTILDAAPNVQLQMANNRAIRPEEARELAAGGHNIAEALARNTYCPGDVLELLYDKYRTDSGIIAAILKNRNLTAGIVSKAVHDFGSNSELMESLAGNDSFIKFPEAYYLVAVKTADVRRAAFGSAGQIIQCEGIINEMPDVDRPVLLDAEDFFKTADPVKHEGFTAIVLGLMCALDENEKATLKGQQIREAVDLVNMGIPYEIAINLHMDSE